MSKKFVYWVTLCLLSLVLEAKLVNAQNCNFDDGYSSSSKRYGRKVHLKQGAVQGVVVEPRVNHELNAVEQYLGIPYAAPPTSELRFMPPGSAPAWPGIKCADMMGPVCPQKLPDVQQLDPTRKDHFTRLLKHLENQSEDCLYLNIYVPMQDDYIARTSKYPVMVYIHGESFEWGSGNPYDGSVLASYGKVIVVTVNFRLGILGFLKVGLEETSRSNFGLVDQVAALVWVQENIQYFGGDPSAITLFGHGTGAACISLLMLSPMVPKENKQLFHRAILMSGTALSDWALASNSRQVTYQVAEALNCPSDDKLAACLRKKRLSELLDVTATTADYSTKFGPIVDGLVIPNDPAKIMSTYNEFFSRFELMYGVTEVESVQLLPPVGLAFGLLEKERDHELRKFFYARCEYKPENCVAHTLEHYSQNVPHGPQQYQMDGFPEPDRASIARDLLLDMLSDARTVAPIALTARYHASVNSQSYFYVFGHTTASREYITTHGEELPFVFGVPLDGPKFHFVDRYNAQEKLFSEVVMTLWTNFAYTGDPNVPRKTSYQTLTALEWRSYEVDWPDFDPKNEEYLYLGIPLRVSHHYRSREVNYWNEILPSLMNKNTSDFFHPKMIPVKTTVQPPPPPIFARPKNVPPWFPYGKGTSTLTDKFARKLPDRKPNDEMSFGKVKLIRDPFDTTPTSSAIDTLNGMVGGSSLNSGSSSPKEYGTVVMSSTQPVKTGGTAMIVLIAVGGVFLLVNVILFVGLYYKCTKLKSREEINKRIYGEVVAENAMMRVGDPSVSDKLDDPSDGGCGIMKMISKSSRSEDTYEAVKVSESGCGGGSYKLSRQMSASTIDPHTKVSNWIAHEIVQRYSPKFLRKNVHAQEHLATINSTQKLLKGNQEKHALDMASSTNQHVRSDSKTTESYSTLGKSPTRPVTPIETTGTMKGKKEKVSIGIDATPAARSPSILRQQPIELTKSLDYSTRSSEELEDVLGLKRSATESNIACPPSDLKEDQSVGNSTIVKIEHPPQQHPVGKSEPDPYGWSPIYAQPGKKMKSFDPSNDVNVTSREEDDCVTPLTPEESLQIIKRRNFPKVLPDYPDRQNMTMAQKRRSMPVASPLFMPIPENPSMSQPNSPNKMFNNYRPMPPPRGCSTLGRKSQTLPQYIGYNPGFTPQSPVQIADEPPSPKEPEITCNNLYVGPLIPKDKDKEKEKEFDMQPIYDNLKIISKVASEADVPQHLEKKTTPKTIITTDPDNPIRKVDPKVIIKPTISRTGVEGKSRGIPRVTMKDNPGVSSNQNIPPNTGTGNVSNANAVVSINESKPEAGCTSGTTSVTPRSQRRQEAILSASAIAAIASATATPHTENTNDEKNKGKCTPSQIPKLVKNSNPNLSKESSSESSPSDESETGTVIKRI
ncbi:uncharacterized protein [Atheta coriaria]|uniref:uncharacterized protein isoform X2 n=1 Tax=Dalotia coriaria TaxID=877792 RepID=UPI0031F3AEDE